MVDEDALDRATRVLYAAAPDDFLATRRELVDTLRADGDAAAAQAVGKLRKPTVAAWIVNAHVLADEQAAERISDLGDRLRAAQHELDAQQLRALSQERRSTVAALTDDALGRAGRASPSTTVQDEVRSTFDAAVADPDVAARLGRLQRAESFSGFGFGDGSPPQLTLVRGGKTDAPAKGKAQAGREAATKKAPARRDAREQPADDPARKRAIEKAREDVERAEDEVSSTRDAEKEAVEQLGAADRALAAAKDAVAAAKAARERSRDEHRKALARRREARRALDRARQGR